MQRSPLEQLTPIPLDDIQIPKDPIGYMEALMNVARNLDSLARTLDLQEYGDLGLKVATTFVPPEVLPASVQVGLLAIIGCKLVDVRHAAEDAPDEMAREIVLINAVDDAPLFSQWVESYLDPTTDILPYGTVQEPSYAQPAFD